MEICDRSRIRRRTDQQRDNYSDSQRLAPPPDPPKVWDTVVVIIENECELATEAGGTGERRVYTWRDRIQQLAKLRFIEAKEGPKCPCQ